ncbi:MAG: hypothetical protein CL847_05655 [Crocinitomicaceae bacterium]|nr:hypothetical protein [Crocinitomicaceae bacterium]|tara:strand:+ start:2304 stop:3788 length:1485 start_codon:yes stop_codon:yes gene_type:complete
MSNNILSRVLFKSEFKSLAGNRFVHIISLFFIFLFSIFCIGSSDGVLKYLEDKMDNAYVNMVDAARDKNYVKLDDLEFLNNDNFKQTYSLIGYDTFAKSYMNFSSDDQASEQEDFHALKIGVIDSESHPLWSMIMSNNIDLKPDNDHVNVVEYSGEPSSIYLTNEAYLKLFDDNNYSDIQVCWYQQPNTNSKKIYLPIGGVTTQLPFQIDAIIFEECFEWLRGSAQDGWGVTIPNYYVSDSNYVQNAPDIIKNNLSPIFFNNYQLLNHQGTSNQRSKITSLSRIDIPQIDPKYKVASEDEYLCFSFKNLDMVEGFNRYLNDNSTMYSSDVEGRNGKIEIDLTKIQTKKYLKLFSNFGSALAKALMLVSIVLIINYSLAILTQHISKNKRNLGTLIAFGFKNNTVVGFYLIISSLLIISSFTIAYLLNYFFGDYILQLFLQSEILDISIDVGEINYLFPDILYSVIGFLIVPLLIIYFQIRKLLKTSPGDLIYNR